LFEVPTETKASVEDWRLAEKTAATYCATCPFLHGECAADPDGRWGIWAGSARWVRNTEVLWRQLIPDAPRPPFRRLKNMSPVPVMACEQAGHDWSVPGNVAVRSDGRRYCQVCARDGKRRRRAEARVAS
jgi:hypothetical protein